MENEEKSVVAESPAEYGKIDVIAEWKRRKAEEIKRFEEQRKTDDYKKLMQELREENVRRGVVVAKG